VFVVFVRLNFRYSLEHSF